VKKILLMPGLGDVHWVLLKLQSWLKKQGPEWERPELWIWDFDDRPRTLDYFQFVPWVRSGGYFKLKLDARVKQQFNLLYLFKNDEDVIFNFQGFDAFIGLNGNMRNGRPFSELLSGAEVDYAYGPELPFQNYGKHQRSRGPYFVLCFSGFGMFERAWCSRVTPEKVRGLVSTLRERFPEHRFYFTGLPWDDAYSTKCMGPQDFSLVGKTALFQFLSLLCHSDGYVGWCGGNSIMSQHLGVPTVEWWSRTYFPKHDRSGWETPHATPRHLVLEVEDYHEGKTPQKIAEFLEVARG
jgi:hypothetical protein